MRRMISEKKQKLLDKQSFDVDGTIVDENDREFNGDINFTGTVTGVGGTQWYKHNIACEDGIYLVALSNKSTAISSFSDFDGYEVIYRTYLEPGTSNQPMICLGIAGNYIIFVDNTTITNWPTSFLTIVSDTVTAIN